MNLNRMESEAKIHTDNKGYSLVELLIVLAIIAAVTITVIFSISMIFSANAKTCAHAMERAIADCKVTTMGKADAYLEIYRDTDGNVYSKMYVYENGAAAPTPMEAEKLGGSKVFVGYLPEGAAVDATPTELVAGGTAVRVHFDRASGSFDATDYANCATFDIQGGSKHYQLKMVRLTGKVSVEVIETP